METVEMAVLCTEDSRQAGIVWLRTKLKTLSRVQGLKEGWDSRMLEELSNNGPTPQASVRRIGEKK